MQIMFKSIIRSSNKIQNKDIPVPAYPGCPGKWPINERRVSLQAWEVWNKPECCWEQSRHHWAVRAAQACEWSVAEDARTCDDDRDSAGSSLHRTGTAVD